MSQLFLESISPEQFQLLNEISSIEVGLLVGGTALSLQIGHRRSYDLDFMTKHFNQEAFIFGKEGDYKLYFMSGKTMDLGTTIQFGDEEFVSFDFA